MPKIKVDLAGTEESIYRPVILSVAKSIAVRLGLNNHNDPLFLEGSDETSNPNDILSTGAVKLTHADILEVIAEEVPTESSYSLASSNKAQMFPIFLDTDLGVECIPTYIDHEVNLTFRVKFKSENAAKNWKNRLISRIADEDSITSHTAVYHYGVPKEFLYVALEVYKLREANHGYGDTFGAYLKKHFHERIIVTSNQSGSNSQFSVEERQIRITGTYTFDQVPELNKDSSEWTCEFGYRFGYSKAAGAVITYPITVHNEVLPATLVDRGYHYDLHGGYDVGNKDTYDFNQFSEERMTRPYGGSSIPVWDDWLPEYIYQSHSTLVRILFKVDADNPRNVIDLNSLGNYEITDIFTEYLKKRHKEMTVTWMCPIQAHLYCGKEPMAQSLISIDENLVITTTFDLDPRKTYHLVLLACNDLSTATRDCHEHLRTNGEFAVNYIRLLDIGYEGPLRIMADGSMNQYDYNDAIMSIRKSNKHYNTGSEVNRVTVGQFAIIGERR